MTQVFLGGSCNPTTWRHDIAIPALEAAGVTFYNPQVEDWSPELVEIEAVAKEKAKVLLFVIDGQTSAETSCMEAVEYICTGRKVVLVVQDVPEGSLIEGYEAGGKWLERLTRIRATLADIAKRHDTPVFPTVQEAVSHLIAEMKSK